MDELISKRAVIEAIEKARANVGHNLERSIGKSIIEILDGVGRDVDRLPPALGTNLASLGTDCISRQQAIDALNEEYHGMISDESMKIYKIIEWLGELPSAQPEVIRCKDCKHWKDSDGVFRRGIGVESKCPLNLHQVYEGTFYCGLGERREVQDENDKTTNNTTNA